MPDSFYGAGSRASPQLLGSPNISTDGYQSENRVKKRVFLRSCSKQNRISHVRKHLIIQVDTLSMPCFMYLGATKGTSLETSTGRGTKDRKPGAHDPGA